MREESPIINVPFVTVYNWFEVVKILEGRYNGFITEYQAALSEFRSHDEVLIQPIGELMRVARVYIALVLMLLKRSISENGHCCVRGTLSTLIAGKFDLRFLQENICSPVRSDIVKKRLQAAAMVVRFYVDRELSLPPSGSLEICQLVVRPKA
jgi:hypothetical protein